MDNLIAVLITVMALLTKASEPGVTPEQKAWALESSRTAIVWVQNEAKRLSTVNIGPVEGISTSTPNTGGVDIQPRPVPVIAPEPTSTLVDAWTLDKRFGMYHEPNDGSYIFHFDYSSPLRYTITVATENQSLDFDPKQVFSITAPAGTPFTVTLRDGLRYSVLNGTL